MKYSRCWPNDFIIQRTSNSNCTAAATIDQRKYSSILVTHKWREKRNYNWIFFHSVNNIISFLLCCHSTESEWKYSNFGRHFQFKQLHFNLFHTHTHRSSNVGTPCFASNVNKSVRAQRQHANTLFKWIHFAQCVRARESKQKCCMLNSFSSSFCQTRKKNNNRFSLVEFFSASLVHRRHFRFFIFIFISHSFSNALCVCIRIVYIFFALLALCLVYYSFYLFLSRWLI